MWRITDSDYMDAKILRKDFEIKKLHEYHDLYLKSDTLLLPDIFENFRKMCLEIYHLDPAKFLSVPGLLASFKKDTVVKKKKQKAQKCMSQKENLNLQIIKTV